MQKQKKMLLTIGAVLVLCAALYSIAEARVFLPRKGGSNGKITPATCVGYDLVSPRNNTKCSNTGWDCKSCNTSSSTKYKCTALTCDIKYYDLRVPKNGAEYECTSCCSGDKTLYHCEKTKCSVGKVFCNDATLGECQTLERTNEKANGKDCCTIKTLANNCSVFGRNYSNDRPKCVADTKQTECGTNCYRAKTCSNGQVLDETTCECQLAQCPRDQVFCGDGITMPKCQEEVRTGIFAAGKECCIIKTLADDCSIFGPEYSKDMPTCVDDKDTQKTECGNNCYKPKTCGDGYYLDASSCECKLEQCPSREGGIPSSFECSSDNPCEVFTEVDSVNGKPCCTKMSLVNICSQRGDDGKSYVQNSTPTCAIGLKVVEGDSTCSGDTCKGCVCDENQGFYKTQAACEAANSGADEYSGCIKAPGTQCYYCESCSFYLSRVERTCEIDNSKFDCKTVLQGGEKEYMVPIICHNKETYTSSVDRTSQKFKEYDYEEEFETNVKITPIAGDNEVNLTFEQSYISLRDIDDGVTSSSNLDDMICDNNAPGIVTKTVTDGCEIKDMTSIPCYGDNGSITIPVKCKVTTYYSDGTNDGGKEVTQLVNATTRFSYNLPSSVYGYTATSTATVTYTYLTDSSNPSAQATLTRTKTCEAYLADRISTCTFDENSAKDAIENGDCYATNHETSSAVVNCQHKDTFAYWDGDKYVGMKTHATRNSTSRESVYITRKEKASSMVYGEHDVEVSFSYCSHQRDTQYNNVLDGGLTIGEVYSKNGRYVCFDADGSSPTIKYNSTCMRPVQSVGGIPGYTIEDLRQNCTIKNGTIKILGPQCKQNGHITADLVCTNVTETRRYSGGNIQIVELGTVVRENVAGTITNIQGTGSLLLDNNVEVAVPWKNEAGQHSAIGESTCQYQAVSDDSGITDYVVYETRYDNCQLMNGTLPNVEKVTDSVVCEVGAKGYVNATAKLKCRKTELKRSITTGGIREVVTEDVEIDSVSIEAKVSQKGGGSIEKDISLDVIYTASHTDTYASAGTIVVDNYTTCSPLSVHD